METFILLQYWYKQHLIHYNKSRDYTCNKVDFTHKHASKSLIDDCVICCAPAQQHS